MKNLISKIASVPSGVTPELGQDGKKAVWKLLVGAGLYFSFRTRFVQVRRFGLMIRSLFAPA